MKEFGDLRLKKLAHFQKLTRLAQRTIAIPPMHIANKLQASSYLQKENFLGSMILSGEHHIIQ